MFKKDVPVELRRYKHMRVDFRFEIAGVLFNHAGEVLMDNGHWMPVATMHTTKGTLIGQRDFGTADNTEFEEIWRGAWADRVKDEMAMATTN